MSAADVLAALRALWGQRMRTALTLLGIVLGTSSLVLLVALLGGGQDALVAANQAATDGDAVVARAVEPPASQRRRTRRELQQADAASIAGSRGFGDVWVGTEQGHATWANAAAKQKRVTMASASLETPSLYRLHVVQGRFFDAADLVRRGHICVIGHEVAEELFPGQSALGNVLTIDGDAWRIVGVLADKPILGNTDGTWLWNRKVLVPETSFDATFNPTHRAEKLTVRPRPGASLPVSVASLRGLLSISLLRRHYGVQNFDVEPDKEAAQGELILTILRVLLFGATAISLLVSGINVMNVMLVTVSERTVEIGIRRALGASPARIRRQFLCEALLLTALGGLCGDSLGALLAWTAAWVLQHAFGAWALHIELWALALGFVLSLGVGLIFGTYPALRAARLDVVAALRNE